jgi:hypothetical protein
VVALAASCAAYKRVPVALPVAPPAATDVRHVRVGDKVRIELADGRRAEFRVTTIEPDALAGQPARPAGTPDGVRDPPPERVAYADIVTIEREVLDVPMSLLATYPLWMSLLMTLALILSGG